MISGPAAIGLAEDDIKDDVINPQFGLHLGVGVDISRFNFDLRFQRNFTKLANNTNAKISVLQFTLGYRVF